MSSDITALSYAAGECDPTSLPSPG